MFRSEPPQIFTFSFTADSNTWDCIVEIILFSWHCSTLLRWWRFLTRDRWRSLTLLLTLVLSHWMEIIVRDMEEEDWQYSSWVCSSISSCKIHFISNVKGGYFAGWSTPGWWLSFLKVSWWQDLIHLLWLQLREGRILRWYFNIHLTQSAPDIQWLRNRC